MNNDPQRPDPDSLLATIQKEEAKQQRGKLKIFFGMVAGVGKTYAMLQAAQQRHIEGVEVVIGYIETHGRAETADLISGLPAVPRQKLSYRNTILEEMDLDSLLARHPQLALVDELAHTNAVGAPSQTVSRCGRIARGGHQCLYHVKCATSGESRRYGSPNHGHYRS